MADEKKKKQKKPVEEVLLRNYPKVIFFWPLFFTSLVLWPIQFFFNQPITFLGAFWLIVFFVNLFIVAFDFSSAKFFLLILVVVIVVLLIIFFVLPNIELAVFSDISINLGLPAGFYMATALILGFILLFVFIGAYFDYYKV
ncbi:MAG: hypothetical protein GF383_06195, partial [Candidatus Lokiarchaeota archaeon]|nr:hypothetical protein [Candidatus Lokiarchaeota archaeon]